MATRHIAVYGKGGIGKSTVSANLSAALAQAGRTVLQVGCDPKHDSTRFLTQGRRIPTVLDYLRVTNPADYRLEDVLATGYKGIGCVEAGGPKPGVGCAGRGIISAFEMLEQFKLRDRCDVTIYDVLGDVVCGGFAVPIRHEYADTILIVTSGEFMALYAANNILRGIRNFDGDGRRVAGLVLNRRQVEDEDGRVERFAAAVGLPVFATVPRSDAFTRAERENMTVMERGVDTDVCQVFTAMARKLMACPELYEARPLTDEQLEETVLGQAVPAWKAQEGEKEPSTTRTAAQESDAAQGADDLIDLVGPQKVLSKGLVKGEPLRGCAFNGALSLAVQLRDAAVIAHAPKSCVYLSWQSISSAGRRTLFERGTLLPASLMPNLSCTEMGEPEIVFGGMERLRANVEAALARRPAAVVVVSSCPAGIIGDDIDRMQALGTPETPVITIRTDGNMAGDYLQGMLMAYDRIAEALIDKHPKPRPRSVNVIAEKPTVTNTQSNFDLVKGWLERLGVDVNCRFLANEKVGHVRRFGAAELTLPVTTDFTSRSVGRILSRHCPGIELFDRGFPIGFEESAEWILALGRRFGSEREARAIIAEAEEAYRAQVARLSGPMGGKRLMVVSYNTELDWILKPALDCGMEVVGVGVLDYSQDAGFRTRIKAPLPVKVGYDGSRLAADLERLKPDVLLTNYGSAAGDAVPVADTIPMCPDAGFGTGIRLVARWERLLELKLKGDWRRDAQLFDKYYA